LLRLANSHPLSIHAFLIRPRAVPFAASTLHADESGGANPSPCPMLDRRGIRNRDGHRCLLERQCTGASSRVERTKRKVATGDTPISTYAHVDGVAVAALRLRCFRFLFPGDRCRGQGGVRQLIEWRRASLADATLARKTPNCLSLRRKQ
jgi:hypothetical protein